MPVCGRIAPAGTAGIGTPAVLLGIFKGDILRWQDVPLWFWRMHMIGRLGTDRGGRPLLRPWRIAAVHIARLQPILQRQQTLLG